LDIPDCCEGFNDHVEMEENKQITDEMISSHFLPHVKIISYNDLVNGEMLQLLHINRSLGCAVRELTADEMKTMCLCHCVLGGEVKNLAF
jgi:hypothetical protein